MVQNRSFFKGLRVQCVCVRNLLHFSGLRGDPAPGPVALTLLKNARLQSPGRMNSVRIRMDHSDSVKKGGLPQIDERERRLQFFHTVIGTLLVFIKQFSLDLKEIHADRYKKRIDGLSGKILSADTPRKSRAALEKATDTIQAYIDRLKEYLNDRERELKDIIDLLTKAMVTVDADNRIFNQKIYEQSEKIERITLLDDIRKIKSTLKQEVARVRKTVREKQAKDRKYLKMLSRKVDTLNRELARAVTESRTDGLTGVHNRLAFDRYMKELEGRNRVADARFSLIFLDIDDFKTINDSFGHLVGDRVILALVEKCREIVRKNDYIARFGGDEFAIVMEGASLKNAVKKAGRLSKALATTRYAVNDAEDARELSFTVSIGVSTYRKGDTVSTVTDRADRALYAAKAAGKSRVVSEADLEKRPESV